MDNLEKYTPRQQALIKVLTDLRNGDMDYDQMSSLMGGLDNFIRALKKQNIIHLLDPFDSAWEYHENEIFYAFYQEDSSFIWKIVDKFFSDVIEQGGKYYFKADADDLASFFRESWRDGPSREGIENIIDGEYDFDISYDVTDDEFKDVYENFNKQNQEYFKSFMKKELLGQTIDINSKTPSLLDEIASEKGNESELELTEDVINRILQDDDCIEYLIMEEMSDTRGELYSLYKGCYDDVLISSWYDTIMSDLEGVIIDSRKAVSYTTQKRVYDKEGNPVNKNFYGIMYEATNCIYDSVSDWLSLNHKYFGSNTISYMGSYKELIRDMIKNGERNEIRTPNLDDYPDYRQVQKCINENIGDRF